MRHAPKRCTAKGNRKTCIKKYKRPSQDLHRKVQNFAQAQSACEDYSWEGDKNSAQRSLPVRFETQTQTEIQRIPPKKISGRREKSSDLKKESKKSHRMSTSVDAREHRIWEKSRKPCLASTSVHAKEHQSQRESRENRSWAINRAKPERFRSWGTSKSCLNANWRYAGHSGQRCGRPILIMMDT